MARSDKRFQERQKSLSEDAQCSGGFLFGSQSSTLEIKFLEVLQLVPC